MNYVNEFKKKIEELLPLLKKAYIAYYGKEYEERINSVVDSIKIVFLEGKKLCKDEEGKIISINEINSADINSINKAPKWDAKACVIPKTYPPIAILRPNEQLSLHTLIHEINHTLHNEKEQLDFGFTSSVMSIISSLSTKGNSEYNEGIKGTDDDLIYEIINDYMSYDILEILKVIIKQSNIQFDGIDFDFDNFNYLYLDQIDDYIIKKFYEHNKDEIKKLLVLARGKEILSRYSYFNYDAENKRINYIHTNFENNSTRMQQQQGLTIEEAKENTLQFLISKLKQK